MNKDTKEKLARLADVLDAFGPDSARWPDAERDELRALVDTQLQGRQLHREARALARVMDAAPSMAASADLKAGILAAATKDQSREARVVPITAGRGLAETTTRSGRSTPLWPAAALAASFALGVFLGASGVGGGALDGAIQFASVSNGAVEGTYTDSWLDGGTGSDAEDLL